MDSVRVIRGVRLPAAMAGDAILRLAAVHRVLPAEAVFSDGTAAELHGLWLPRAADPRIHVTVPAVAAPPARTTGPQRRELRTHRRHLAPAEIGSAHGIPVTSLSRTWCDLAESLTLPDLVAAGDAALQCGAGIDDLATALAVRRGCRGRLTARRALPLLCARSRSRPETHLRMALVTAGLPPPTVNEAVYDLHGQWLAEPDLSYREARLAIEYQGGDHADPRRMRKDLARQLDLQRSGWIVLCYSASVLGTPEVVIRDVLQVLTRRAPTPLARRPAPAALTRVTDPAAE